MTMEWSGLEEVAVMEMIQKPCQDHRKPSGCQVSMVTALMVDGSSVVLKCNLNNLNL